MIIFNIEVGTMRPAEFRHMIEGIRDGIKSVLNEPFMIIPSRNGVGQVTVVNGEGKVVVHSFDKDEIINLNYNELREYINNKMSQLNNQ